MVFHVRAIRRFTVRTVLPQRLAALEELSLNLHWSWDPETRDLFAAIDHDLWQAVGEDPVRLLGEVSAERLAQLANDDGYVGWVEQRVNKLRGYLIFLTRIWCDRSLASVLRWFGHSCW